MPGIAIYRKGSEIVTEDDIKVLSRFCKRVVQMILRYHEGKKEIPDLSAEVFNDLPPDTPCSLLIQVNGTQIMGKWVNVGVWQHILHVEFISSEETRTVVQRVPFVSIEVL